MNPIRSRRSRAGALATLALPLLLTGLAVSFTAGACTAKVLRGELVKVTVDGPSLKDNQLGFPAERECYIYLPPSYVTDTDRKYPVLYLLHGIGDSPRVWIEAWDTSEPGYGTIQELMDRGIQAGLIEEMIVVVPNSNTPFFGCFYTNSSVKGRWEDFITKDLVAWVEDRYRVLETREARGIMGHSMGGYGALKLSMLHPDVYSVAYGMSPALLGWGGDVAADNPQLQSLYQADSPKDLFAQHGFYVAAVIGISQAFSPNPNRPPFLADYPFKMEDGKLAPGGPGHDGWHTNMPVHMVPRYTKNLLALRGIRFDAGYEDKYTHIPPTSKRFSDILTEHGVPHVFEMYNGDHNNRLWGSQGRLYTEVLPYFSDLLVGEEAVAAGH